MLGGNRFFQTESACDLQLKVPAADDSGGRPSKFHMPILRTFLECTFYLLCPFTLARSPLAKVFPGLSRLWRMSRQRRQSTLGVQLTRTEGLGPKRQLIYRRSRRGAAFRNRLEPIFRGNYKMGQWRTHEAGSKAAVCGAPLAQAQKSFICRCTQIILYPRASAQPRFALPMPLAALQADGAFCPDTTASRPIALAN